MVDPIVIGVVAFGLWSLMDRGPITSTTQSKKESTTTQRFSDPSQIDIKVDWVTTHEWRTVESVGTNSEGVEFVVEGRYTLEPAHPERRAEVVEVETSDVWTIKEGVASDGVTPRWSLFKNGEFSSIAGTTQAQAEATLSRYTTPSSKVEWFKVEVPAEEIPPQPHKYQYRASQISNEIVTPFAGQVSSFGSIKWGVPYQAALESAQSRFESSEGLGPVDAEVEIDEPLPEVIEPGEAVGDVEIIEEFPDASSGSMTGFDLGHEIVIETQTDPLFLGGGVTR